jgi:hypothetical protein
MSAIVEAAPSDRDTLPACLFTENPYRLVSLWGMLRANADRFVKASTYLSSIHWTAVATGDGNERARAALMRDAENGRLKGEIVALRKECESLAGMQSTITHIDRFLPLENLDVPLVESFVREIDLRFREDLERQVFLQINPDRSKYYCDPVGEWRRVADRFKCEFDIEETRKCLALGRFTASVFHCMKIVEAAVLELQVFLKQPDVKAHFGSVLSKLENMTQKQDFRHLPAHLQPYKQFMIDVLAQLHAVKDSWRNKVSHVGSHIVPEGIFTEEMSRGIHDATLLLMQKMVDGLPPAVAVP